MNSSLKLLTGNTLITFRRFPLALLASVFCTVCMIQLIGDKVHHDLDLRILMSSYLGMVLFTGAAIFFERYNFRKSSSYLVYLALIAFLVYYYFSLPVDLNLKSYSRFIMISLAAHLGVSFAPFLVDIEINGFWQYNKTLFLRFLSAALYSIVLFAGLSLAILAIDRLFTVHFDSHIYIKLGCIAGGIFNTWFFLSGVPDKVEQLENDHSYPKGLRIFTQYILLPLVTFYLLILYTYTAKILITIVWPRGWVSYLVIGFSTLGILALLLVWPRKDEEKHKWIRTYIRTFFFALFPLILLLAFAIGRRVKAYGVTENRYFVIMLATWLFINALYFLFSQLKNIKFIPMSLFVATLLSGYGPWSSFSISEHSQRHRLKKMFEKYHLMKDGFVLKATDQIKIKDADLNEISSMTAYLCNVHGVISLQPIFHQRLDSLIASKPTGNYYEKPERILGLVNIDFRLNYYAAKNLKTRSFNFTVNGNESCRISGYDYIVPFNVYSASSENNIIQSRIMDSTDLKWNYKRGEWLITVSYGDKNNYILNCKPLIDSLIQVHGYTGYVNQQELIIKSDNETAHLKLLIRTISGEINKQTGELELRSLDGQLLVKEK